MRSGTVTNQTNMTQNMASSDLNSTKRPPGCFTPNDAGLLSGKKTLTWPGLCHAPTWVILVLAQRKQQAVGHVQLQLRRGVGPLQPDVHVVRQAKHLQGRAGQGRAGQGRAGQGRAGMMVV